MSNEKWLNNGIQYPRLLAEIMATQDNLNFDLLSESMDLSKDEIVEIFDRAQNDWDAIKNSQLSGDKIYFFEVDCNEETITQSDEYDVSPEWVQFSIYESEFNLAKSLISDVVKEVSIDVFDINVNENYTGDLSGAKIVINKYDASLVFFNDHTDTKYTYTIEGNLADKALAVRSKSIAKYFKYPSVVANLSENGNLTLTVSPSGINWLQGVLDNAKHTDFDVIEAIVDDYQGLGIPLYRALPEHIGALTDAPIVSDTAPDYEDSGNVIYPPTAKFWWYEPYQISSFAQKLIEEHKVVFQNS